MERTWSSILPLLAGAEFAIGLGNIENTGTNSFTQLVMDDELFASIKRMLDGISVDDNSLALEVIAEVGPKGNYLGASHTVKNYRSATRPSDIFDHANRGTWEKAGAPTLLVKIEQKIEHILANHQVESLSDDQIAALDEIIAEAEATLTTAEG
jgi:trimethylamine--corrinoid protein Co-methyltransferase